MRMSPTSPKSPHEPGDLGVNFDACGLFNNWGFRVPPFLDTHGVVTAFSAVRIYAPLNFSSSLRAMMSFCNSFVPSPIIISGASR